MGPFLVTFAMLVARNVGLQVQHASPGNPGPYEVVSHGTCEDFGFSTILGLEECLEAGRTLSADLSKGFRYDQPEHGYTTSGRDRPSGCTFHNGNHENDIQFFPSATGECGTANYHCLCSTVATGSGDPHMTNIMGEKFDIWRLGEVELLRIPQSSTWSNASLRMIATVTERGNNSGNACVKAPYMTAMRLHGSWLDGQEVFITMIGGKMKVSVGKDGFSGQNDELPISVMPKLVGGFNKQIGSVVKIRRFNERQASLLMGSAMITVTHDNHPHHFFLNMAARRLKTLGLDIGGILGMDDHTEASKRPAYCSDLPNVILRMDDHAHLSEKPAMTKRQTKRHETTHGYVSASLI